MRTVYRTVQPISKPFAAGERERFWFWMLLSGGLLLLSCRRQPASPPEELPAQDPHPMLARLADFFTSNGPAHAFYQKVATTYGRPRWDQALFTATRQRLVCLLPVLQADKSQINAILAIEWDSTLRIKVMEPQPAHDYDSSLTRQRVTQTFGLLHYAIWKKQTLSHQGKRFTGIQKISSIPFSNSGRLSATVYTTCYEWINCTGDGNGNCVGNVTYHSECITEVVYTFKFDFVSLDAGGYNAEAGGGGSYEDGTVEPTRMPPPEVPIVSPADYLRCFDMSQPAQVTICADQPARGSDEPITILGGLGHAFITLEQTVGGQLIRRTLGFYPSTPVNPFQHTSAASTLGNDQQHTYDVSLSRTVDGQALSNMLTSILQFRPIYDLERYNCVDFVLDVAHSGGIHLPRTEGWWIFGRGANPGAFGEDLRQQPGAAFQTATTAPNAGDCPP